MFSPVLSIHDITGWEPLTWSVNNTCSDAGLQSMGSLRSDFTLTFHFHALEKKMATHSSVLAWRIPGTGGAWWAAVHWVAQSQTWLKRLSSSMLVFKILIITKRYPPQDHLQRSNFLLVKELSYTVGICYWVSHILELDKWIQKEVKFEYHVDLPCSETKYPAMSAENFQWRLRISLLSEAKCITGKGETEIIGWQKGKEDRKWFNSESAQPQF